MSESRFSDILHREAEESDPVAPASACVYSRRLFHSRSASKNDDSGIFSYCRSLQMKSCNSSSVNSYGTS